jgi:hypothetical protein
LVNYCLWQHHPLGKEVRQDFTTVRAWQNQETTHTICELKDINNHDNACAMAQAIPCYILRVSLTGKFWQEIEKVL